MPCRVIGHRGAPGHRPDHTLEGYALALEQGATVIEPDLVPTRDGVLIARHENDLTATTNVADVFPDRKRTRRVDGKELTGFFSEDFTLAEIKRLFARQPLASRSKAWDDQLRIPTFEEILDLVDDVQRRTGRRPGIEPETKHPTHFHALGLPLEPPLLASLRRRGLDDGRVEVWIQSFEAANLAELKAHHPIRLLRLLDTPDPTDDAALAVIAGHAHGVGLHKGQVIGADGAPTGVVERAHAVGLEVHVYTFRDEPDQIAPWAQGDPVAEVRAFVKLGVDAVFADHPDTAVRALLG